MEWTHVKEALPEVGQRIRVFKGYNFSISRDCPSPYEDLTFEGKMPEYVSRWRVLTGGREDLGGVIVWVSCTSETRLGKLGVF